MSVIYLVRRHRPLPAPFSGKAKTVFSDQYEVVSAHTDLFTAHAKRGQLTSKNKNFKYSIERVAL